jgi:hypothetical protein
MKREKRISCIRNMIMTMTVESKAFRKGALRSYRNWHHTETGIKDGCHNAGLRIR